MKILQEIFFIIFGYLCGSILFAHLTSKLLYCGDITQDTSDGNPGTTNAFLKGGFLCGALTLCGDLLKGFFPVWMYLSYIKHSPSSFWFSFILAAPVIGHIFPLFYGFHGGKGIATTFGCLLALLPNPKPLLTLAFFFIFFSVILRISPHFHRTIITYICSAFALCFSDTYLSVQLGFLLIVFCVIFKMFQSKKTKERCKINLLWMR